MQNKSSQVGGSAVEQVSLTIAKQELTGRRLCRRADELDGYTNRRHRIPPMPSFDLYD
ncbi:MAG: hypothetical protein FWG83_02625 [Oscillospiraceae bacterium]|nr:hypothetical protein [Oscillospiraceae bacterium]